jgi:hypothetical protein
MPLPTHCGAVVASPLAMRRCIGWTHNHITQRIQSVETIVKAKEGKNLGRKEKMDKGSRQVPETSSPNAFCRSHLLSTWQGK